MPNYQNGTIYKISCKNPEITDCYVGSTVDHNSRKSSHKSVCNNENSKDYNLPVYRYIRDNGGWNNWEFVLLEDYPCRTKKQLNIRERLWLEKLGAKLNSCYPERSNEEIKEYRKDWKNVNKEHLKQYRKNWREENKEHLKEYYEEKMKEKSKEYYEVKKEEILEKTKEYREKNREKINKKAKEYRKKNKEKISEKQKEKVECECGSVVRKHDLTRHKRTQKHQNWEKTQVE